MSQNRYEYMNGNGSWNQFQTSWSKAEGATHNNYMKRALEQSERACKGMSGGIPKARCVDSNGGILDILQ